MPWAPEADADGLVDIVELAKAARIAGEQLPGPKAPNAKPLRKRSSAGTKATAKADPVAEALAVLRSSEAPAEIARAGAALAARLLAQAYEDGTAGQREIAALARALEELRRSSQAEIDRAKELGDLVPKADMIRMGGELASVFVRSCDRIEAAMPDQVVAWFADSSWRSSGADSQRRSVADWVSSCLTESRNVAAEELSGGDT